MTMKTVFGFFPRGAREPGRAADGRRERSRRCPAPRRSRCPTGPTNSSGAPCAGAGPASVIDRVSFWPGGGEAGLGASGRGEGRRSREWFFKAHFFQDPVQPGSLGIEAMQQAARAAVTACGAGAGRATATNSRPSPWVSRSAGASAVRWCPPTPGPEARSRSFPRTSDDRGVLIVFKGAFWVDDLCIYDATGMGVRVTRQR